MLHPIENPPPSWQPRLAASMTPGPPPVMTANPASASCRPTVRAVSYIGSSRPILAEPNRLMAGGMAASWVNPSTNSERIRSARHGSVPTKLSSRRSRSARSAFACSLRPLRAEWVTVALSAGARPPILRKTASHARHRATGPEPQALVEPHGAASFRREQVDQAVAVRQALPNRAGDRRRSYPSPPEPGEGHHVVHIAHTGQGDQRGEPGQLSVHVPGEDLQACRDQDLTVPAHQRADRGVVHGPSELAPGRGVKGQKAGPGFW